jgi:hypothetical protein
VNSLLTYSVDANRNQRKQEIGTDWTSVFYPSESSDSATRVRSAWKKRVGRVGADSNADAVPTGDPASFWTASYPALVFSEEEPRHAASPLQEGSNTDIEGVYSSNACYGGTAALLIACIGSKVTPGMDTMVLLFAQIVRFVIQPSL